MEWETREHNVHCRLVDRDVVAVHVAFGVLDFFHNSRVFHRIIGGSMNWRENSEIDALVEGVEGKVVVVGVVWRLWLRQWNSPTWPPRLVSTTPAPQRL